MKTGDIYHRVHGGHGGKTGEILTTKNTKVIQKMKQ